MAKAKPNTTKTQTPTKEEIEKLLDGFETTLLELRVAIKTLEKLHLGGVCKVQDDALDWVLEKTYEAADATDNDFRAFNQAFLAKKRGEAANV